MAFSHKYGNILIYKSEYLLYNSGYSFGKY